MSYQYEDPMAEAEQGLEEANTQFLREAMTDAADEWITWVLNQVDEDQRQEIIQAIQAAIAPLEIAELSEHDVNVLTSLSGLRTIILKRDLVGRLEGQNTPISERTLTPVLQSLQRRQLIEYPNGPRSGMRITQAGRNQLP